MSTKIPMTLTSKGTTSTTTLKSTKRKKTISNVNGRMASPTKMSATMRTMNACLFCCSLYSYGCFCYSPLCGCLSFRFSSMNPCCGNCSCDVCGHDLCSYGFRGIYDHDCLFYDYGHDDDVYGHNHRFHGVCDFPNFSCLLLMINNNVMFNHCE